MPAQRERLSKPRGADPTQKVTPSQPDAPVGARRNHRRRAEPAAEPATAAKAAEQENAEQPADTSDDSAASGESQYLGLTRPD